MGGSKRGGERGLEVGRAPEREGLGARRRAGAAEAIPRIHYCKHLPGVVGSGGGDRGAYISRAASEPGGSEV